MAGRTLSLQELRSARNLIPEGKEAKMILRDPQGGLYHVDLAERCDCRCGRRAGRPSPVRSRAPADQFRAGGRGREKRGTSVTGGAKEGEPKEDENVRDRK